jgi:hypothetical protein
MKALGIPETIVKWTSNFLSNRSFNVVYNNSTSSQKPITCGVSQGSCLSPTLFIIYFSDLAKEIPTETNVALFADDLFIWTTNKCKKIIQSNLQAAFNKIKNFCQKWWFSINKSKTNFTMFTKAGHRKWYYKTNSVFLHINGNQIPLEPFPTFLGIKLDPKSSCPDST